MSRICGVYEQPRRRVGTGSLPCARGKHTPQTPQSPQRPGQRLEKLAGFGVQAKLLNPARLRGLRVMRVIPAGFEKAARAAVCAGQQQSCGLCVLCGVTFSLRAYSARYQRQQTTAHAALSAPAASA